MGHFEVQIPDSTTRARLGRLTTSHGVVETPVFMPVGTCGAVKGITPEQLQATGASVMLANTYHLMLRPGVEVVERLGGLHALSAWPDPILTDSGGYQVFSLNSLVRIDDAGVEFASHVDGARVYLDAATATSIQNRLGADIIMCFDQCTPFPAEPPLLETAVRRTLRWAEQCKQSHNRPEQMLFAVVQGGIDPDLRTRCASQLVEIDFDGYAIGGLSVGEGHQHMIETVNHTTTMLPAGRPRYLMGVGNPSDIIASVMAGIDMFDCVLPTRNGRNAYAFTACGPLRLRNSAHACDGDPIETGCDCYCCRTFSRGAIRHFFNVSEMLGPILLSLHNLRFYQRLMAEIREHLAAGSFAGWARGRLEEYLRLSM